MKKRILALILTVAMMVAVLPFAAIPASAADNDGIVGTWFETQDDGRTYQGNSAILYNFASTPGLHAITYGGEGFLMGPHTATGAGVVGGETVGTNKFASYKEAIAAGCTPKSTTVTQIKHVHTQGNFNYLADNLTNADFGSTPYVAMRLMFKDNTNSINYTPAALQICLGDKDSAANRAYCTNKFKGTDGATMLWLDANDGSCTKVYPTSTSSIQTASFLTFLGDMNGYLLIPLTMFDTATNIPNAAAYLKKSDGFMSLVYVNPTAPAPANGTASANWNDKDLYIGDVLILNDKDAFVSNYIAENGITKYATNYGDGSIIVQRVPANMPFAYNLYKSSSTNMYQINKYTGSAGTYMPVVSLANGDAAFDITDSTHKTAAYNVYPTMNFSYDGSNPGIGGSTQGSSPVAGIDATALAAISSGQAGKGYAIRVATAGNEGKTINFKPTLGTKWDTPTYSLRSGVVAKFIDATTGAVSEITSGSTGFPLTGNVDGWIVIDSIANTHWNYGWWDVRASLVMCSANVSGLDGDASSAQKIYMGDTRLINNVETYMAIHGADTALDIRSASLALEDNISVNVKINKRKYEDKYGFAAPKATFTYVENTKDAVGTLEGQSYNFKLTGLAVQRAIDALDAVVYSPDGTKSGRTLTTAAGGAYSVKQYCVNQLASTTNAKLKTLLTDLLNYAAEAQKYTGYNAHALANDGIDQSNATANLAAVDRNKMSHVALDGATLTWKSASLRLTDTVEIKLNFNGEPVEGSYVVVTDANDNVIWNRYGAVMSGSFTFNALNADQMRDVVKFTLYNADGTQASGTLSYSIEAYVAAKANDAEVGALVTAMMKYGDAAIDYRK